RSNYFTTKHLKAMENQDKNIDKHFRKLAEEQQPKSFPNMDKVWDNIEQKLDRKPTKKVFPFWKYAGIAAAVLVFVSLGIQFMNNQPEKEEHLPIETEKRIVVDEKKAKEILDEQTESKEDVYAYEDVEDLEEKSVKGETHFTEVEVKKDEVPTKALKTSQEDFDDSTTSGRADKETDYGYGDLKSSGMQTGKAEEPSRSQGTAGHYNNSQIANSSSKAKYVSKRISDNDRERFYQSNTESYESFQENPFESAKSNPVSTFSIDVDNASYTNIRRFINNGQTVPKDAVRIEEMINFFKYDYAQPKQEHPFAIHTEYSDAPWNPNHKLLRIALKGEEIPTDKLPKSNFVFLVDVSGSMDSPNKLPLLKSSMKVLLDELRDDDRVSIVYYASGTGVLLEPTKASDKKKIVDAIDNMRAGGGTSGAAGLGLAYEMAEKHFVKNGNNRIILATDGDFNIGKSSDEEMQELIEEKRKSGVYLTC